MKRLCFGTFIDILLQCKKEKINKTQLTTTVIRSIDPNHKYDTSDSSTRALNHLYKCTSDFTKTYSNIKELAPDTKKAALVKYFTKDVIPLIDTDKYELAILALCDIIKGDATLDYKNNGKNVKKFQNYIGKEIKDVLTANEYILCEFFAAIFRYTIIEIKNTDGKEWLESISQNSKDKKSYEIFFEEYVESFRDKRDTIQVWADTKQKKKVQATALKALPSSPQTTQNTLTDSPDSNIDTQIDLQETNHNSGLSIPTKYQTCLYCEYFSGLAKTLHKNVADARGICSLYDKTMVSTHGTNCQDFNPNYAKISLASLRHDF